MSEEVRDLLITLLIFLICTMVCILSVFSIEYGSEEYEIKHLCVDGKGSINLEGIMCQGKEISLFGMDPQNSVIFASILVMVLFFSSLVCIISAIGFFIQLKCVLGGKGVQ